MDLPPYSEGLPETSGDGRGNEHSQFRQMVDQLSLPAYLCDATGLITHFNQAAVEVWGREPKLNDPVDQYCGSWRLYHGNDSAMRHEDCWMAVALKSRQAVAGEDVVIERPDGTRRTALAHATPYFDEQGELIGAVNVLVDITERKQQEEQFRVATENSPIAKVVVNPKGAILMVNRRTEELFGYDRDELLGQPVEMLVPERFRGAHPGFRGGFMNDPTPRPMGAGRDLYGVRKDGSEVPIEIGLSPIHTTDGVMVLSAIVDITERKEAERALRGSEERLRELNQSLEEKVQQRTEKLVAYQEQLRLLAAKLAASEQDERRRVAVELHDNLAQLLAICKMKLSVARRELPQISDNQDIESVSLAVDDALMYTRTLISELSPPFGLGRDNLDEAIRWVANKMAKHGLDVVIDDDGEAKPMDGACLTTAFESVRELLFNVVRHGATTRAQVNVRRRNEHVVLTVADEGIGFDPSLKPLVPSERGGLGLFSVRERVTALGGNFALSSAPGEGTRATIELPIAVESPPDAGDGAPSTDADVSAHRPEEGHYIRVLLVDDHEMMREGLRRIINNEPGMEVVAEASDGEMAIGLSRELRPDVIVMDVGMPKINGIDATRRIKALDPQARIVALSLNETDEAVEEMMDAGASAYIFKSQAFGTLCAAIRDHAIRRGDEV